MTLFVAFGSHTNAAPLLSPLLYMNPRVASSIMNVVEGRAGLAGRP